ncbi:MAG: DNA recombination protein RmuC, partial [Muribaculaceae bacterium]|nr:DNA recombination protein RmuC [Muribaculaceae bacterium]
MPTLFIAIFITAILSSLITWLICRTRSLTKETDLIKEVEILKEKYNSESENHRREIEAIKETHHRIEQQQLLMFQTEREVLMERQKNLQDTNRTQISELLDPIRQQFDDFRKSVEESRTAGELSKEDIKKSFETTMKLFSRQQQFSIEALRQQTEKIGNDAANLSRVLRHDSKVQGDWGEMILENLLESSGLERDTHFFIQENVKDESGRNFRPDVIVRFPEGRSVIIDSKVSITAFAQAFDTDDDTSRKIKLKEHARSVRKHIDELADKKYDALVSDSIGLVLMFIPNDQCYLAAIDQDKDLPRYAYSKGIVMISPSNLMIALQLTYNMWQQDRQTKNVETIVRTATELYEKVAIFSETIQDVETHINRLNDSF